jgi:hypothetical protein
MVKKGDVKKEDIGEKKDIFKLWADSYTSVSKMWEEWSFLYRYNVIRSLFQTPTLFLPHSRNIYHKSFHSIKPKQIVHIII